MRAYFRRHNGRLSRIHPIRRMELMLPNTRGEFAEFGNPLRRRPIDESEATPRREFAHSALSGATRGIRRVDPEA